MQCLVNVTLPLNESTFDVNVSRELQLELYSKYSALLEDIIVVFC